MRRLITIVGFLILGIPFMISAQSTDHNFNPKSLNISWELVDNTFDQGAEYRSILKLTNTGNTAIPADGWSIYLNNLAGEVQSDKFELSLKNGDLFKLTPTSGFSGIKPGTSLELEIVSPGLALNISSAPDGLYWVWDSNPDDGLNIGDYTIEPVNDPEKISLGITDSPPTPMHEIVYQENKKIKNLPADELVKIFPTPKEYHEIDQEFQLTAGVPIQYDSPFQNEAEYLAGELEKIFGQNTKLTTEETSGKKIYLRQGDQQSEEGYNLRVTNDAITITASQPAGIFYGIQSIKTLLPSSAWSSPQSTLTVPGVDVTDAPRFGHRAFMQDVARNFRTAR